MEKREKEKRREFSERKNNPNFGLISEALSKSEGNFPNKRAFDRYRHALCALPFQDTIAS